MRHLETNYFIFNNKSNSSTTVVIKNLTLVIPIFLFRFFRPKQGRSADANLTYFFGIMPFFNKAIIEKYFCLRRPPALLENWKTRFADAVQSREFLKLDFLSSGIWTFQYRKLFSVSIVFNLELLGVLLDVFISRCAVDLFNLFDVNKIGRVSGATNFTSIWRPPKTQKNSKSPKNLHTNHK